MLSIGDRCEHRAIGKAACERNERGPRQLDLPEDFPVFRIEAKSNDISDAFFFLQLFNGNMRRDEEAVTPHGDIAHSCLRHRSAPADVFVSDNTPVRGRLSFYLPVSIGTRSLRPIVVGGNRKDKEWNAEECQG